LADNEDILYLTFCWLEVHKLCIDSASEGHFGRVPVTDLLRLYPL
jgi:hypothetical protein